MTLKLWLITGALAVATFPVGAQMYRWVDASGTVHYSDTPREGAEEIQLKPTNVIRSQTKPRTREDSGNQNLPSEEESEPVEYTAVNIQSPTADQTLWNIGGTLTVRIQVEPKLQEGHGVVLFYDGRLVSPDPVVSSSITINNVYRGQHSVRAAVRDLDGNTVFNGSPVSFYVRQSTQG